MLTKEQTAAIVKEFGKNEKDTGSTQVQVAILTHRINELTAHLKAHHKDNAARRGLFILIGQRRSLLAHLKENDRDAYIALITKLNLRK